MARSHYLLVFLHYIHSYTFFMTFAEFRSSFFIAVRSGRGLHWGSEPGFELGAAIQQPAALPTEPRRTLNEPRRTLTDPLGTLQGHAAP
jgi:hypothetical protein